MRKRIRGMTNKQIDASIVNYLQNIQSKKFKTQRIIDCFLKKSKPMYNLTHHNLITTHLLQLYKMGKITIKQYSEYYFYLEERFGK